MPSVDVIDLNNKKVGTIDLADEVFGAAGERRPCSMRAVRHSPGESAPARHGENQDAARSGRVGQEIVEAEGHGPGAYGFRPQSSVAAWRHHAWSATARLFLQAADARCSSARLR